jgi:hypothetical protein
MFAPRYYARRYYAARYYPAGGGGTPPSARLFPTAFNVSIVALGTAEIEPGRTAVVSMDSPGIDPGRTARVDL